MTYLQSDESSSMMGSNILYTKDDPIQYTTTTQSNFVLQHTVRFLVENINDNENDDINEPQWKRTLSIVLSNVFLFFLIFGLSATCDSRQLKKQLTNKFAIGTGITMQYVVMPILGFVSVIIFSNFGLSKAAGITLLVATASPGGSFSNWWCSTFNADLALSVAMTTISSLLSVVFLPLNLFLYSWLAYTVFTKDSTSDASSVVKSLDFKSLFESIAVVICAILSGLVAGYKWDTPTFHNVAHKFGSMCGLCLMLFSIVVVSGPKADLGSLSWSFYVAVTIPCLGGLLIAHSCSRLAKLSPPEVMSISIECCCQNAGIATSIAITMFQNPTERAQAVAVPIFHGIATTVSIFFFCIFSWKMGWTKAPPNENFWSVITKTYEVDLDTEPNGTDTNFNEPNVDTKRSFRGAITTPRTKSFNERNRANTDDSIATASVISSDIPATPERINILSFNDDDIEYYDVEDPIEANTTATTGLHHSSERIP